MASDEWGDFQTPQDLANDVIRSLKPGNWSCVLEPTCGLGNFLEASLALGPEIQRIGIEVQTRYVESARARGFDVLDSSIFDMDLSTDLGLSTKGRLLVVGNPPWVTSAELGSLGSINLPRKSNIKNLSGFDAMTGASNFDIAEFIFLKLMVELEVAKPTIALLVKTQVARNVLAYSAKFKLPYSDFQIRRIDAKAHFGASVDACLFSVEYSSAPEYRCDVFEDLFAVDAVSTIGVSDGQLVADMSLYSSSSFADGLSPIEWRSGIKHDASKVMELPEDLAESLNLESDFVFPLLKCSDLYRDRLTPKRRVVIPQRKFGEDTSHLVNEAPVLWSYLEANSDVLDRRGSSIYRNQSRFAVFGLGEYTFAPYKVAISGFHKSLHFVLLGPFRGKPVVVDDASYALSFTDGYEAAIVCALLSSTVVSELIDSLVFWDSKRPINKKLLQRIDLLAVAGSIDTENLFTVASGMAAAIGLPAIDNWSKSFESLIEDWCAQPQS
jgi:hypothetical protein